MLCVLKFNNGISVSFYMRSNYILFLLICFQAAFAQKVGSLTHNYGKVKDWNNPVYETTYTNLSGETQLFLPIAYSPDISVNFEKNKLLPGESTIIKIQYFTEEFGRFNKEVEVYVSNLSTPLTFKIAGNIQSFHPDALVVCPRIDNTGLTSGKEFKQTIKVIDIDTKEPLSDFEITITTGTSKERFYSRKSTIELKRDRSDFYRYEVDKEGYELAYTDMYLFKNDQVVTIALKQIETDEETFDFAETTPEEDSTFNDIVKRELEKLKERNREIKEEREKQKELESDEVDEETNWLDEIRFAKRDTTSETDIAQNEESIEQTDTEQEPDLTNEPDFKEDGSLNETKYAYNHLVFLIDISGSMKHEDKLPLLKYSMHKMINVLRPEDKVSIITYSTEAIVLVSAVSGSNKQQLNKVIDGLTARGQSYGQEGVDMAYELAKNEFINQGNNEIILASDGVFNSRGFKESKIYRQANKEYSSNSIRLSAIGFGKSKNALGFLEKLASSGSGSFIQIKKEKQAESILIENMMQHSRRDFINN
jgi:Ca-activated chloride channel family protein